MKAIASVLSSQHQIRMKFFKRCALNMYRLIRCYSQTFNRVLMKNRQVFNSLWSKEWPWTLVPPVSKWNSSVELQAWDPLLIFSFSSLTLSLLPLLKEGYRPGCTGTHYRPRVKSPPDHAFWIPWLKVFATTSTQCFCHRLSLSS